MDIPRSDALSLQWRSATRRLDYRKRPIKGGLGGTLAMIEHTMCYHMKKPGVNGYWLYHNERW